MVKTRYLKRKHTKKNKRKTLRKHKIFGGAQIAEAAEKVGRVVFNTGLAAKTLYTRLSEPSNPRTQRFREWSPKDSALKEYKQKILNARLKKNESKKKVYEQQTNQEQTNQEQTNQEQTNQGSKKNRSTNQNLPATEANLLNELELASKNK